MMWCGTFEMYDLLLNQLDTTAFNGVRTTTAQVT